MFLIKYGGHFSRGYLVYILDSSVYTRRWILVLTKHCKCDLKLTSTLVIQFSLIVLSHKVDTLLRERLLPL